MFFRYDSLLWQWGTLYLRRRYGNSDLELSVGYLDTEIVSALESNGNLSLDWIKVEGTVGDLFAGEGYFYFLYSFGNDLFARFLLSYWPLKRTELISRRSHSCAGIEV